MSRKIDPNLAPDFPFVSGKTLDSHIELGRVLQAKYRIKLVKDIYWVQQNPGEKVLYNLRLWKDYFLRGEGREHDRLVEQYLKSIQPQ